MKYIAFLFAVLLISSCELMPPPPECVETDPFEDLDPNSNEYQSAAIFHLEVSQPESFRYFFKTFVEEKAGTYMWLNFRNDTQCFDVKMLVEKWDKLAGMRKVNGKSYPKELVNLKWTIETIEGNKTVVYQEMNTIID